MHGAPFRVGFVVAPGFYLKHATAYGPFPAQGDIGGMRGGNGAHVGHLGGQAHAAAARIFHIDPGGLELGRAATDQAGLDRLRPPRLLASLAEQLIAPVGFGLQLRFEQVHPIQTLTSIRHEGFHLINPELGLMRFGGAFQVGDDAFADEELLQRGFVAKAQFGKDHILLLIVTRPRHDPAIQAEEAHLLNTIPKNARGMTKV